MSPLASHLILDFMPKNFFQSKMIFISFSVVIQTKMNMFRNSWLSNRETEEIWLDLTIENILEKITKNLLILGLKQHYGV